MAEGPEQLRWAVTNGDIDSVKSVVEKDPTLVNQMLNGRYPMCIAADYNQNEVIEYLIEKGGDVNLADKHGITPLLSAIYEGHTNCVQLLLQKGASKVGKAPDGTSYIDCAEKEEIKKLLK